MLAVNENLAAALRILRCRVAPTYKLLRARREQLKVGEIAIEYGKLRDVRRIELNVHIGSVGLELRNFARDFDGLSDFADLQLCIHVNRRVGGNLHTSYVIRLKSSRFH